MNVTTQVWAYYRGGKDYDFNDALKSAVRKMDDGSGTSSSGMSDISWTFRTRRGAVGAASRMKSVYRKFGKTGKIDIVPITDDDREVMRRRTIKVSRNARRHTKRRRRSTRR